MRGSAWLVLGLIVVSAMATTGMAMRPLAIEAMTSLDAPAGPVCRGQTGADGSRTVAGVATYYADDFHGLPMADGRMFDMHDPAITASNRWPLGTRLRVRRVSGGPWDAALTPAERSAFYDRSIIVTVQDRGAFDHELDQSLAAFSALGRPAEGRINVSIEPLDTSARETRPYARSGPLTLSISMCGSDRPRI